MHKKCQFTNAPPVHHTVCADILLGKHMALKDFTVDDFIKMCLLGGT